MEDREENSSPIELPAVLLSDCWSLISAERNRILKTSPKPDIREVYTPPFLRSLYVRFDEDCDGRLSLTEMHSLMNIYLNDVVDQNSELPQAFTEAVTRAILIKNDANDFVTWMDFLAGFPIAVRHRKALWDQFSADLALIVRSPDE